MFMQTRWQIINISLLVIGIVTFYVILSSICVQDYCGHIDFNMNIEAIKNSTKDSTSKCSCRLNEKIDINEKDETYIFNVVKGKTTIKNYTIPKKEFLQASITCDPEKALRRGPHQKVISYSIFGDDRIYYRYLDRIIENAKRLYPGWVIRIYHDDDSLTEEKICDLECSVNKKDDTLNDNVDFCSIKKLPFVSWDPTDIIKTFWRWFPVGDSFVDVFMSRDSDSCLTEREEAAVSEWLNSTELFHIMRDHPFHNLYMLAGLWGMAVEKDRSIAQKVFKIITNPLNKFWHKNHAAEKQADQIFLRDFLYDTVKKNVMIHDSFNCESLGGRPFPTMRPPEYCHVGGYGCCGPNSINFNRSFPHECPEKCRPRKHKEWVFC